MRGRGFARWRCNVQRCGADARAARRRTGRASRCAGAQCRAGAGSRRPRAHAACRGAACRRGHRRWSRQRAAREAGCLLAQPCGAGCAGRCPMSGDFLSGMAASSHERVRIARQIHGDAELWRWAEASPPPPPLWLSPQGFDVIAEVKLRSPAVGQLRDAGDEDITARVTDYAAAGAAAVSVLTEPERFEGSLDHLEQAARALAEAGRVPAMRKDFLVDPYQVAEARLAGAGGILVIVR